MNEDFDNTAALELGKLVAIAYGQLKQTATPVQALLPAGYKSVATLEIVEKKLHLPFGFIAINGANACIAIRGTVTPLEWLDDASIRQLPFHIAWGDTTTGFKSIYDQLSPTIIRAVAELYQTGAVTSLYIAGHSLGAAIALLAAADILIQLRVPAVSYTFAGPRCGDPELADAFTKAQLKVWRIFNTEDIVPTLPFAAADFAPTATGLGESLIELALKFLIRSHVTTSFQHIGSPVALTFQTQTIVGNHDLLNHCAALQSAPGMSVPELSIAD